MDIRETVEQRLEELRAARDQMEADLQRMTAELTAVHGAIAEYEHFLLPHIDAGKAADDVD